MPTSILIADDDEFVRKAISQYLSRKGYVTLTAASRDETIERLEQSSVSVALIDLRMPGTSDLELLTEIKAGWPQLIVIMMTAYGSIELAIDAVRKGAFDFLTKPFEKLDVVALAIQRALDHSEVVTRLARAQSHLESRFGFSNLIGHSKAMQNVFKTIKDVAYSHSTVLVLGESGTGKELVARAIHLHSSRKEQEFVTCNCGALTESLLESELFGHVKGAFTGAISDAKGLFETANNGTLFLDEIGETPPQTQVKLLRALQDGEIKRVGDSRSRTVDVRIIAATNKSLEELTQTGAFRQDLYYRINVIKIKLPPLRERKDDIEPLVDFFIKRYADRLGKTIDGCSGDFFDRLYQYEWPGNVRELENLIERAVVIAKQPQLTIEELPETIVNLTPTDERAQHSSKQPSAFLPYKESKRQAVDTFNMQYLTGLLKVAGGNITKAAEIAGMHRSNFKKLMRDNQITAQPFKHSQ